MNNIENEELYLQITRHYYIYCQLVAELYVLFKRLCESQAQPPVKLLEKYQNLQPSFLETTTLLCELQNHYLIQKK